MDVRRWVYTDDGAVPIDLDAQLWLVIKNRARARGLDWHDWTLAQLEGAPPGTDRGAWLEHVLLTSADYQITPIEAGEPA